MISKSMIQFHALTEDADYFKELQFTYRKEGKYAAELFRDLIKVYKDNINNKS